MLTLTGASQAVERTAVLAVSLVLAGWFVGHGFARGRSA